MTCTAGHCSSFGLQLEEIKVFYSQSAQHQHYSRTRRFKFVNRLLFSNKKDYFVIVIDFNFENNITPARGTLLVSEPFMHDKYFARSVVYLCDHNDTGSFGFVLNNYLETNLTEMINDFPDVDIRVSIGGPVDTSNLFFIHSLGEEIDGSALINDGIYIGGNFERVKELITDNPKKAEHFRFFVGYSGWEKEQLKDEMDEKSLVVVNKVPRSFILNDEKDDLWNEILENMGGKFKVMSTFPKNPADN